MQNLYKEIGRIAARPVNILIRGATGTGKELVARAIYQHSDRAAQPFITINCAAIPENLLESELFGHERGAFTGAEARRIGRFEQAHQGTIFLDEIGDMTPGTQVKLLRVLQDQTLQRLGGKETITVDARVIAATHHDLETAMRERRFREDLFYRLSVVTLTVPPLGERTEDIPDLVHYFLRRYGRELGHEQANIQPEAIDLLRAQPWPGNIRELENVVRKALLLSQGYTITEASVREALPGPSQRPADAAGPLREFVADLLASAERDEITDAHAQLIRVAEKELVTQAIQRAGGNQSKAARWLGISRLTMREKLHQYGARPSDDQAESAES